TEDVTVVAGDVVELVGVELNRAAGQVVADRAGQAAQLGERRAALEDAVAEADDRAPAGALAGHGVGAAPAGGVVDGHEQAAAAAARDRAVVGEVNAVAVVHNAVAVHVGEEDAAELRVALVGLDDRDVAAGVGVGRGRQGHAPRVDAGQAGLGTAGGRGVGPVVKADGSAPGVGLEGELGAGGRAGGAEVE